MTPHDPEALSRLRGFLEVTRVVRSEEELGGLLASIARSISESLGFATVTVHLHRPAWDDFEVTTVHGSPDAERLLGDARGREVWEPLLDARFSRRGAYHVPHGEFDWETFAPGSYVPPVAAGHGPDGWHPYDALFVPLRHPDGHLIGILSVDEPASGRIPTDEELDVLVAMADHAAIAVQSAQEAEQAARHRAALEQLLQVSSRLTETFAIDEILQSVCDGIHTALGFENVCIDLPEPDTGVFRTRATYGWDIDDPAVNTAMTFAQIERLLDPQFEVEGCYLLDHQEGVERVGSRASHLRVDAERARAARMAKPLAHRPALEPHGRRHGRDLGRRPDRPARPVPAQAPGLARLRKPGDDRARHGRPVRGDAVPRRARSADAPPQPARLQRATRAGGVAVGALRPPHVPRALRSQRVQGPERPERPRGRRRGARGRGRGAHERAPTADAAFRIGGDEFALILPETGEDDARAAVDRVARR